MDRFLEARFSLFLRADTCCFCEEKKAQNTAAYFKALRQRGHHATLSAYATLRAEQSSRSRCAHRKARFSVAGKYKRKISRIMAEKLQTFSASRFFSCRKTTPPFENDSADKAHYCALRRNSVSPQDRFLEARFSLFLRESVKVSCSPYPQKFTFSALARATSRTRSENAHGAF